MSESQRPGSIPSPRPPLRASPFNGIKLGLAAMLVGGIPLYWIVENVVRSPLGQLAVLGCYGLAGMAWAMARTRGILREGRHGAQ